MLRRFLIQSTEQGRVQLTSPEPAGAADTAAAWPALVALDERTRAELCSAAPPLSRPAAVWGLTTLYRACQLLVFRALGPTELATLAEPCPEPDPVAAAYGVDLTLRHVPDLLSLARGVAPADPLVVALHQLARDWPLSSVGVAGLLPVPAPGPWWSQPALRGLYVDRVIATADASRLADPRVREAVDVALGEHGGLLCPGLVGPLAEVAR